MRTSTSSRHAETNPPIMTYTLGLPILRYAQYAPSRMAAHANA